MTINRFKGLFFILFLAGFLLAGPSASAAEKTVGIIMTGNISYYKDIHKAFTESLSAEGIKPEVVVQTPMPDAMSWTNAARKLAAIGSDVIVSYGAPAALAAMNETTKIPIVFAGVYDPQSLGLTGKNVTGISSKVPVTTLIKNFRSIANFSNLGIIYSDAEKDTVLQVNEVKPMESSLGFRSTKFIFKKLDDVSRIAGVDALFLTTGCAAMHCVNNIVGAARKAKIPTAATIGSGDNSGIILTITANPEEQGREAAERVAKILRGAAAASLPVEHPKKIDMIINIKEAADLGLKIPFDILSSATKVIK